MLNIRCLTVFFSLFLILNLSAIAQISANFSIDNQSAGYCKGDTVKFTNTSTGTFVNTHWKFGDNIDTWGNNPLHIYQVEGNFTIWMIITTLTGEQDSISKIITIHPAPKITLVNDIDERSLTVQTGLTEVSFLWYFGVSLTDEADSIVYYLETGNYSVVAFNEFCSDSVNIFINLDTLPDVEEPEIIIKNNILTPDLVDGANDVLFIQDLGLYSKPVYLSIYNKWGQLVYENQQYTNLGGFTGSDNNGNKLDAGTYYYIVKCEGRKGGSGFVDIIR
jgi:PKD repeat protein